MKLLISFIILSAIACGAQDKPAVLVGASGGSSFGNLSLGPTVEIRLPFGHARVKKYGVLCDVVTGETSGVPQSKNIGGCDLPEWMYPIQPSHFELDLRDTFDPLEEHVKLGKGYDNVATIEPVIWLTKGFGLDGRADWSQYRVTKVSKHSAYIYGGITTRGVWLDAPVRVALYYFREVNNGIYGRGIETSRVQGGSLYLEAQVGCTKHACYYTTLETAAGTLLEQGNPVCDGSFGKVTCQRNRTISGSGIMGFLVRLGAPPKP
jgi:hypothetical protein